jgi:hypothetical protein
VGKFTIKLKEIFNITNTDNYKANTPTISINNSNMIDGEEYKNLIEKTHVPAKSTNIKPDSIIAYSQPIQEKIEDTKRESDYIRSLLPEIKQAEAVLIPSILSPNDLQESNLNISVSLDDNVEELETKLGTHILQHLEDKYEINNKLEAWLKPMLYGVGAKPIMILPNSIIKNIMDNEQIVGNEHLLQQTLESVWNKQIYTNKKKASSTIGMEDLHIDTKVASRLHEEIIDSTHNSRSKIKTYEYSKNTTKYIANIEKLLISKMSDSELLSFHENPEIAGLCELSESVAKQQISNNVTSAFRGYNEYQFAKEPIIELEVPTISENLGNATLLELPTESIIPIHTPGTPTNHVGYFLLLDKMGNPLQDSGNNDGDKQNDYSNILKSSNSTAFGGQEDIRKIMDSYSNYHSRVVNQVYEHILDKYLIKQIDNLGLNNVDITTSDSITKCMFRRLMENKETRIVFIPKDLLVYMCFDYNEDGTGKSKLEDIKFVLSLRISLMVSKIMAAMEDAVNKQRITLEFDEKMTNPLETMETIRNSFIAKKKLNLSYRPSSILQTLTEKSLTMVPKNIPGLASFNLEADNASSSSTRPDEDLSEELRNMSNLALGVPPSALNNLNEDEYSRSVATSNIFFSNTIRKYQKTLCSFIRVIISTYIKFSKPLRDELCEIITASKAEEQIAEDATDNLSKEELLDKYISQIIKNITVSLPKPNIAPDKAQFNELREYKDMISDILESIYPEDILMKDRDASEGLTQLRAYLKSNIIRNYIISSGFGTNLNIPQLNDTFESMIDINTIYQTVLNFHKGFDSFKNTIGNTDDDSSNDGYGY